METKFKVGDWVFCEFKLQIVETITDGEVSSVSDGFFTLCGHHLTDRCFPMSKIIKVVSDNFLYMRERIHREGNRSLNFPDINRKLIELWVHACEASGDNDECGKRIKAGQEFTDSILRRCKELGMETVGDVRLFQ